MGYLHLSLSQLHQLLGEKKITPRDLVDEAIKALKENKDNALEYLMEKEAYEFVDQLGEFEPDNILWGIPFVIKDNFSTKNVPTTGSSNILNGYVPIYSSEVYQRLIDKKAIPVGKTTLDELAMGGSGMSGHLGRTFNPYDPSHKHQIGGSSCGSAALVAAGIVPYSIGSDTGDSVRKPASFGGLVGFKPTWGRISRYGLFPFAPSLDHVAYFTRNVSDSASLLSVLAGHDEKDATSSILPLDNYSSSLDEGVKNKKIAVIQDILDSIHNKVIKDSFNKSLKHLQDRGAIINYVHMDIKLLKAIYPAYIVISCAEATSNNANLDGIKFGPRPSGDSYQEVMMKARTEGFSELIKRRFIIGSYSLLKENQNELYLKAKRVRRLIVDAVNNILKDNDVVYLPASPCTAPLFDNDADRLSDEYLIADNYLAIGNFAGLPSIALPIGFDEGLPFGGNLTGKAFKEKELFQIANEVEKGTGYKDLSVKVHR